MTYKPYGMFVLRYKVGSCEIIAILQGFSLLFGQAIFSRHAAIHGTLGNIALSEQNLIVAKTSVAVSPLASDYFHGVWPNLLRPREPTPPGRGRGGGYGVYF